MDVYHVASLSSLFPLWDTLQAFPLSYVAIAVNVLLTAVKVGALFHLCCFWRGSTTCPHLPKSHAPPSPERLCSFPSHVSSCSPYFFRSVIWMTNHVRRWKPRKPTGWSQENSCVSGGISLRGICKCLCEKCGKTGKRWQFVLEGEHSQGFRSPGSRSSSSSCHSHADLTSHVPLYGGNRKNVLLDVF